MGYITNFKFTRYEPVEEVVDTFQKKRLKASSLDDFVKLTKV